MSEENERLRDVLAAYGADPARWPAGDRNDLSHLIDGSREDYLEALEVDRLLQVATAPDLCMGAADRVIRHIHALPAVSHRPVLRWTAALPLAASLLLGIYLGALENAGNWLPEFEQASTIDEGDGDLTGVGEAEIYSEENLT